MQEISHGRKPLTAVILVLAERSGPGVTSRKGMARFQGTKDLKDDHRQRTDAFKASILCSFLGLSSSKVLRVRPAAVPHAPMAWALPNSRQAHQGQRP